ncbi:MAG TPA: branched-chain amino acid ABC transporter ATP-binding protein/permease [Limnochordales bacterium]
MDPVEGRNRATEAAAPPSRPASSRLRYLAALLVLIPALAGAGGDPHLLTTLTYASVWAVYGVGYDMFSGYSGRVNLGYAMFPGLAAYVAAILNARLGWTPVAAMLGGVVASGLLALLVGALTLRIRGIYFALATSIVPLALGQLTRIFARSIGGEEGIWGITPLWSDSRYDLWTALALLAAAYLFAAWYTSSKAGLVLRAIQGREDAAQAVGQNTHRVLLVSFLISAVMGAGAGAYIPHFQMTISPEVLDIGATLQVITFTQVGGPGTLVGPAVGAFGLVLLNEYLREFVEVRLFAYFLALVLLLRFAPRGVLAPAAQALVRAVAGRRTPAVPAAGRSDRAPVVAVRPRPPHPPAGAAADGAGGRSVILQADRLTKRFGGLVAVQQVSFSVREGEVVGLVGPNGAGKTTLFNMLTGFIRPTEGRVLLRGTDITHARPHEIARMGLVRTFQLAHPFPGLSVLENLVVGGLGPAVLDLGNRELAGARERAREVARFLGLERWLEQPAEVLPYGVLKRLEVGRALMADPRVLLLDEPFAGIGGQEFEELLAALSAIAAGGRTVVIIEHKLRAIMQLTRRVIVLHFGQIIADGTPQEVAADPGVQEAYLGVGGVGQSA